MQAETMKKAMEKGMEDAVIVDYELESGEVWSTYKTSDGSVIKVKTILNGIARLDANRDQFGRPVYVINTQNIVRLVSCPKELIKKPQKPGVS